MSEEHTEGLSVHEQKNGLFSIQSPTLAVSVFDIQNKSDAVLWAAAPELLEACKKQSARINELCRLLRYYGNANEGPNVVGEPNDCDVATKKAKKVQIEAQAAIAKAEGNK